MKEISELVQPSMAKAFLMLLYPCDRILLSRWYDESSSTAPIAVVQVQQEAIDPHLLTVDNACRNQLFFGGRGLTRLPEFLVWYNSADPTYRDM